MSLEYLKYFKMIEIEIVLDDIDMVQLGKNFGLGKSFIHFLLILDPNLFDNEWLLRCLFCHEPCLSIRSAKSVEKSVTNMPLAEHPNSIIIVHRKSARSIREEIAEQRLNDDTTIFKRLSMT